MSPHLFLVLPLLFVPTDSQAQQQDAQSPPDAPVQADAPKWDLMHVGKDGRAGRMLPVLSATGPTLISVFATWCEPCLAEVPTLKALYAEGQRRGLRVVGISVDEDPPPRVLAWLRKHDIPYPLFYADADFRQGRSLVGHAANVPTTLLVSASGKVLRRWVGYVPERILRPAVEPLLRPAPKP